MTGQEFRRIWGPDETQYLGDEVVYELTSHYEGRPSPSGLVPHVEVTYYVQHQEGWATDEEGDDDDRWTIDCWTHAYLIDPAVDPDESNPLDDEFSGEGGSDLYYRSEADAIEKCRTHFADHDESWKLNGWEPA